MRILQCFAELSKKNISACQKYFRCLLGPEVVVEAVPGGQLAALVDQHRRLGPAVVGELLVGGVRGHQGQLDGVEGVGGQDLREEAGVDHRGLGPVRAHQVDRLGLVLLPLGGVLLDNLAWTTDRTLDLDR